MSKHIVSPSALPKPFGVWSPAILCSDARRTLYISGLTSRDSSGAVVGEGNYAAQTRQICENLKATVEAAGGSLSDIVSVTVFVVDIEQFDAIHRVRREYFPKEPPASTMVQVSRLVEKKCLIEINAIAVIG